MDTDPTVEARLLSHAERQTKALESLRAIALLFVALAALGLLIWLIGAMNGAGILA